MTPEDDAVYFVVGIRPTTLFLEEQPDLPLGNEDGLYAFSVSYFDENLEGAGKGLAELTIAPGAEVFHLVKIMLGPDGSYRLEIREGLDLMSLEAWEAAGGSRGSRIQGDGSRGSPLEKIYLSLVMLNCYQNHKNRPLGSQNHKNRPPGSLKAVLTGP